MQRIHSVKSILLMYPVIITAMAGLAYSSETLSGKGYLSNLQTVAAHDRNSPWLIEGNLLNRLEGAWQPIKYLSVNGSLRTRLIYGDFVEQVPGYATMLSRSAGFLKMSRVIDDGQSWLVHSEIDRLYAEATAGSWQVRAGRHRINWGLNLAWNLNDLFNTFSLFDVDYPERPGTDAVLVEYYPSPTSDAQLVWQAGETPDSMGFAGLYRFNRWGYDFQAIGGVVRQDLATGGGWSGQIAGGGFRGECTWFHPLSDTSNSIDVISACVSGDYTFSINLYVHAALLYTSNGSAEKHRDPASLHDLLSLSAKKLSTSRYSCLGQITYPITPLLKADLMTVVNPIDRSLCLNPTLRFSISDNIDLSLLAQLFKGDTRTEFGDYGAFVMAKLRWSF
jgi:hypothetical protein